MLLRGELEKICKKTQTDLKTTVGRSSIRSVGGNTMIGMLCLAEKTRACCHLTIFCLNDVTAQAIFSITRVSNYSHVFWHIMYRQNI